MPPAPTMQDIATAAGRGKATVSLALRNDPKIRESTRNRIQQIAREMGYRSNAMVANLMTQLRTSKTPRCNAAIGYLSPALEKNALKGVHPFHLWQRGIKKRSAAVGYDVNEFRLAESGISARQLMKSFNSLNIHGLIISSVTMDRKLPEEFSEIWERYSCIVIGIQVTHPPVHFVSNDQYFTAFQAVKKVLDLGYRRPGLVMEPIIDTLVENRFSSAFYSVRHLIPAGGFLPHFDFSLNERKRFETWYLRNRPDVILTFHDRILEWLVEMGVNVPGDVGLVHLDLPPGMRDWAGMNQNNDQVGIAAVDMLVGQLHRNESGPPPFSQCLLVQSDWVDGGTVLRR